MAKLVSKVYGDALFETAMEKELVDILYEETSALLPILQANPELFSVLGNPQIVKEEKVALLHQVFSGKIAEELMRFLSIIVEKDRQNEIISILEYFIQGEGIQKDRSCLCDQRSGAGRGAEGRFGKKTA